MSRSTFFFFFHTCIHLRFKHTVLGALFICLGCQLFSYILNIIYILCPFINYVIFFIFVLNYYMSCHWCSPLYTTTFKNLVFMFLGAAVGIPLNPAQSRLCMVDDMSELSPLAIAYARARGKKKNYKRKCRFFKLKY